MPFGHDMVHSLGTVVDLLNTSAESGGEETLRDLTDLAEFIRHRQISGIDHLDTDELRQIRTLRDDFHQILTAPDQPTAVVLLNALLSETRITPRLTEHDGHPLHVHYFAPGSSLAEHLAADCGVALAQLLITGERERLRTCSAPGCSRVFFDESRNRSRVYCDSRTCGNRMHVAAYRARRRA
ncbi:Putative stress-induced transcription regulator [Sinosporangium album]|uniref:Putative stress-induced transcription regulator n=1 Tax=Sinosporangium album TaxID=504805 RepID=A0A1G7S8M9_9ACTN|nr:CGNR zinc finger domain-containing protein [Sinosporangium album]SDG19331.1 Putative stress-induced transcription regulator [Sinosporangium album]